MAKKETEEELFEGDPTFMFYNEILRNATVELMVKLNKLKEYILDFCEGDCKTQILIFLAGDDKKQEALKIYKNNIKLFILKVEHMRRRFN